MSTRRLIVVALVTGLAILVAGAILLNQVARQEPASRLPPVLPPGATSTTVG